MIYCSLAWSRSEPDTLFEGRRIVMNRLGQTLGTTGLRYFFSTKILYNTTNAKRGKSLKSAHPVRPRPFSWIPHVSGLEYATFLACINQDMSLMAVSIIISVWFLGTWYLEVLFSFAVLSLLLGRTWRVSDLDYQIKQVTRNQHSWPTWVILLSRIVMSSSKWRADRVLEVSNFGR